MLSTLPRRITWSLGLAVALGLVAQPADGQPPPPPQQQQQTIDVDEQILEQFAHAYLDVQEINQELEVELGRVGDDVERAQQLQQEYSEEMNAAVLENDLRVEEYRQIVNAINTDEELRGRFVEVLQEIQEEREPRS